MLAEDELSEYLLKKTNYSKTKTIESEAEMSTSSDELVLAGIVAVEMRIQTDLLGFFLQRATSKYTKNLPAKLDSREIANFLAWVQLCHKTAPVAGLKPPIFAKW